MELLFSNYPSGTMRFFKKVIAFSFFSGVLVHVPMAWVLFQTWQTPRFCARVLRGYHLTRLVMFVLQIPLRLAVLRTLAWARSAPARDEVVARLLGMVRAPWWKINQATGVLAYLLFAFALVFSIAGRHCAEAPAVSASAVIAAATVSDSFSSPDPHASMVDSGTSQLYSGLLLTLGAFVLHMLLSLVWVRQIITEDQYEAAMWRRGMDMEQINRFTKLVTVDSAAPLASDQDEDGDASARAGSRSPSAPIMAGGLRLNSSECSICFNAYQVFQSVRVLPCAHHFCASCIDAWLQRKKTCPLCSTDIDSSRAGCSSFSRAARAQWSAYEAQSQAPRAGDPSNNIVVRTVLTDVVSGTKGAASVSRASAAATDPVSTPPSASAPSDPSNAVSSPSSSSSPRPSSTSPSPEELLAALRSGRRGGQPRTAATYTTTGTIETPSAATSAVAGLGLSQSEADALAAIEGPMASASSSSSARAPVKQVHRAASAPDPSSQPSPSARAAPRLPPSRQAYAAARLAAGGSAWRAQLDQWAEEEDDGDEIVRPTDLDEQDFFADAAAMESDDSSTTGATKTALVTSAAAAAQPSRPAAVSSASTSQPAASAAAIDPAVERLFQQWQLEEQQAGAQSGLASDDQASDAESDAEAKDSESKS